MSLETLVVPESLKIVQSDEQGHITDISPNITPHGSPIKFGRQESRSFLSGTRFLPNSANPSPAVTVPNTPDPPVDVPPTVPTSPTNHTEGDETNDLVAIRRDHNHASVVDIVMLEPLHCIPIHTPQQTPDNTHAQTTPAVSKRSTATSIVSLMSSFQFPIQDMPPSSLIVPVMIPDPSGDLMEQSSDVLRPKMVMRFAILVSNYKKVFLKDDKKVEVDTRVEHNRLLHRRRSVTYLQDSNDAKSKLLMVVDQHSNQATRAKSAHEMIQVRMLLSIGDLHHCPSFQMDGKAFSSILQRANDNFVRKAREFTTDTNYFRQQTFIPCHGMSELSAHCVGAPLIDDNQRYVTVTSCSNIIGRMYVKGWPESRTPIIHWYSDDRLDSRQI
jgi:hypothetical protein